MKVPRAALVLPALALVAACGAAATQRSPSASAPGGSSDGKSTAATLAPAGVPVLSGYASGNSGTGAGTGGGTSTTPGAPSPALPAETKAVISTGQISVRTQDIDKARFDLQKLLDRWGGTIANEKSDADKHGRTVEARLQLRIPSSHFDEAMNALPGLGVLIDRSRNSEDVTTQVIDNNVRVRSQKLSLARIQALLAQAKDINQIIAIESELSQRQADLDSLEQQQKYLADQTSLSTVDLYLTVASHTVVTPKKAENGFLGGLHSGWHHLGSATTAVLTAVGAALPFAFVVAILGLPVWVLRRRRLPKTATPAIET